MAIGLKNTLLDAAKHVQGEYISKLAHGASVRALVLVFAIMAGCLGNTPPLESVEELAQQSSEVYARGASEFVASAGDSAWIIGARSASGFSLRVDLTSPAESFLALHAFGLDGEEYRWRISSLPSPGAESISVTLDSAEEWLIIITAHLVEPQRLPVVFEGPDVTWNLIQSSPASLSRFHSSAFSDQETEYSYGVERASATTPSPIIIDTFRAAHEARKPAITIASILIDSAVGASTGQLTWERFGSEGGADLVVVSPIMGSVSVLVGTGQGLSVIELGLQRAAIDPFVDLAHSTVVLESPLPHELGDLSPRNPGP